MQRRGGPTDRPASHFSAGKCKSDFSKILRRVTVQNKLGQSACRSDRQNPGNRRIVTRPLFLVDRVRRSLAEDMRSDGIKITRAKPAFASTCLRRSMLRRGEGGAGGVRTLVQTTAKCAFYIRSRFIGFRSTPGEGHPSMDLCPVSYLCSGQPHRPVFQNYTPNSKRRSTGLSEEYSFAVLLFARIKLNGLRPLSCESVLCFAG